MKLQWMRVRNDLMDDHRIKQITLNKEDPFIVFMRILLQSGYHKGMLRFSDNGGEEGVFDDERLAVFCGISVEKLREIVNILSYNNLLKRREDGTIEVFEASRWFGTSSHADDSGVSGSTLRMRKLRARRKSEMGSTNDGVTPVTCDTSHPSQKSIDIRDKRYNNIKKPPTIVGGKESGRSPAADAADAGGSENLNVDNSAFVGESTFAPISRRTSNRTPVTREEVEWYIQFVNEKCNTKVSKQDASDFWDFVVMRNTDPMKTVVTKHSIGKTLHAFLDIRKRERKRAEQEEANKASGDVVERMHHITSEEIQKGLERFDEEQAEYERKNAEAKAQFERELAEARKKYGLSEDGKS